ncbi:FAD-dependent oxidoreductase [cf. Phormidesmis sp. LEGE 11477]|nr:FAD-dependent oxidoreductase [cf. Phormidesmis sp. LEGE 11477]
MDNPVLLVVDDDLGVLKVLERDLRGQYGGRFRILRSQSGEQALDILERIELRSESLALIVADQRMPKMTGLELLERSSTFFPQAKRVLLTAYTDTEAAIRAINETKLDYYLLKPWEPPEDKLYPVLDDLIDDWLASYRPLFKGIRIISCRWSQSLHRIKDFLARNHLPYQWLDIEQDIDAQHLIDASHLIAPQLPLVILSNGTVLQDPTNLEIAEKAGLKTQADESFYDLIIVGAGPTGLAAAVYGASEGLHTLLIDKEAPGGQAGTSSRIENYLGFPKGVTGAELARRAIAQAKRFGVEFLTSQEVTNICTEGRYKIVFMSDGSYLYCHSVVLATGVSYRTLTVPGADQLDGLGIYYGAAMTEAFSCTGQDVYILGGANSAGQAALCLAKYARQVTILLRGDSLSKRMSQYLIDQINLTEKIALRPHSQIVEVKGERSLESLLVKDLYTEATEAVPAQALFVFIGATPRTEWLEDVVARNEEGYVLTGPCLPTSKTAIRDGYFDREPYLLETDLPGVFAAGDVRANSVKRVASAVGEGSIVVQFIHRYLEKG